jgi:hypothetical protein
MNTQTDRWGERREEQMMVIVMMKVREDEKRQLWGRSKREQRKHVHLFGSKKL